MYVDQIDKRNKFDKLFDGLEMVTGRLGLLGSVISGVAGMFKSLRLEMERKQGLIGKTP